MLAAGKQRLILQQLPAWTRSYAARRHAWFRIADAETSLLFFLREASKLKETRLAHAHVDIRFYTFQASGDQNGTSPTD